MLLLPMVSARDGPVLNQGGHKIDWRIVQQNRVRRVTVRIVVVVDALHDGFRVSARVRRLV